MIKIAYLVEAHTDLERLVCLCDALILSGDVFVHVDKKTKDAEFWAQLNAYEKNHSQVVVLKERHYVAWAGFSQVECFKSLLSESLASEKKYDRFLLLSGLDFPVWSPKQIVAFFENNKDKEFVCGYNISDCKFDYQLRKIQYYHFFRDVPLPHKSLLRRGLVGGAMLFLKYLGVRRKPYFKYQGKLLTIYFGSQWISVTRSCAEKLQGQLHEKAVVNYFKTVYAPDELCVPTLVMNSEFRKKAILVDKLTFQGVTPLHYLNYEDCIWSYDENDYETIVRSGKMFVRKVVSGKSEKLIEMIKNSWQNEANQ